MHIEKYFHLKEYLSDETKLKNFHRNVTQVKPQKVEIILSKKCDLSKLKFLPLPALSYNSVIWPNLEAIVNPSRTGYSGGSESV